MRSQPGSASTLNHADPIGPYRSRIAESERMARQADKRSITASEAMADYESFARSDPITRLRALEAKRVDLAETTARLSVSNAQALSRYKETDAALASVFNISKWFNAGEKLKKALVATRKAEADAIASRLSDLRVECNQAQQDEDRLRAEVERYRQIDNNALKEEATLANDVLRRSQAELEAAKSAFQRIEQRCGTLIERHDGLVSDRRRRAASIAEAERIDERLSNDRANARYWHQQSQEKLGNSSPGYYLRDARRELRAVERDIEKLGRRLADEVRLAGLEIDTLVLDGLNICYDGGRFVGLAPVVKLADALAKDRRVTVYFDSEIRARLRMSDKAIAQQFSQRVRIEIAPTETKADWLLLEYANHRLKCYVISNDRFSDFPDMAVVSEQRVIRHNVANGHVIIPDLSINLAYR